jgi:hypothetical protein
MKIFTEEMLTKLTEANESTKGTLEYTKYHMECDAKTNDRWHFLGWYIPHSVGTIKTYKDKTYIITQYEGIYESYLERYTVSEEVKELLGI